MNTNLVKLWEMVRDREAWHAPGLGSQRVGDDWVTEQQQVNFEDRREALGWHRGPQTGQQCFVGDSWLTSIAGINDKEKLFSGFSL